MSNFRIDSSGIGYRDWQPSSIMDRFRICLACQVHAQDSSPTPNIASGSTPESYGYDPNDPNNTLQCAGCKLTVCSHKVVRHDGCNLVHCPLCSQDHDHIPACDLRQAFV